jgi:O-antigen/teichoic acid export membrane protein
MTIADPPATQFLEPGSLAVEAIAPARLGLPETDPIAAAPRDRHFDTSHLNQRLKHRIMHGGAVMLSAQVIKFALRTVGTALLARLLLPVDFGLIAMVAIVTAFADMFKDAGLSMATVQREKITQEQISTLFWINAVLSAAIALLLCLLAPLVSLAYHEPKLTKITMIAGTATFFSGLAIQHQALLKRQMKFGLLAAADVFAIVVGMTVAITMAMKHMGCWSLVGMTVSTAIASSFACWILSGWVPTKPQRKSGVRTMLSFGGNLAGSSLISYFSRNGDNAMVGWYWGPAALGEYSRAFTLLLQPWGQVLIPLAAVVEPALCRQADSPTGFKRIYRLALCTSTMITFPLTLLSFLYADTMVGLLLGSKWLHMVPIFQAMVPAALMGGVRTANGWLFIPLGNPRGLLRWTLFTTPMLLASFAAGLKFGPIGVAAGLSVMETFLFITGVYFAVCGTFVNAADVFSAVAPALFAGCVATWSCMLLDHFKIGNAVCHVALFVPIFGLAALYAYNNMWRTQK